MRPLLPRGNLVDGWAVRPPLAIAANTPFGNRLPFFFPSFAVWGLQGYVDGFFANWYQDGNDTTLHYDSVPTPLQAAMPPSQLNRCRSKGSLIIHHRNRSSGRDF